MNFQITNKNEEKNEIGYDLYLFGFGHNIALSVCVCVFSRSFHCKF